MTYNPEIHHRRSIRLKGYDYSQAGVYFVTVCAWNKEFLFGEIKDGKMLFNEYGEIVMKCWNAIPGHFVNVACDEFMVMPNHIHGIISISNVGAQFIAPSCIDRPTSRHSVTNQNNQNGATNQGVMNHAPTIFHIDGKRNYCNFSAPCTSTYGLTTTAHTSASASYHANACASVTLLTWPALTHCTTCA